MKYKKKHTGDKKKRILDAAVKIFAEKGFKGATVKEIAKGAGVAEGTIFTYFDTKKDILIELAAASHFDSFDGLFAKAEVDKKNIEDIIIEFLKNWMKNIISNLELYKVLFYEAQFHEEIGDRFFSDLILKGSKTIELLLGQQKQQEKCKEFNPIIAMEALIGLSSIFITWNELNYGGNIEGNYYSYDMVISQVIEIFLYGIVND